MQCISVKNLRSLKDTNDVKIKNLNLFLGGNSSGKSTLLRLFPLIKQSSERNKTSPILWFGRFVDFGSFKDSVYLNNDKNTIEISFSFDINSLSEVINYWSRLLQRQQIIQEKAENSSIKLTIVLASDNKAYTYSQKLIINYEQREFTFIFDSSIIDLLDS